MATRAGGPGQGQALCDPATQTCEPSALPGGMASGSAVEACHTAVIVHPTEYAK